MKFCTNCGAQLPDQTKFCSNCGQKLELPVEPVAPVVPVDPDVVSQKPLYTPPTPPVEPVAPVFTAPVQAPVAPPAPPVQEPAEPVFVPPVAPPAPPVQEPVPPVFVPPVAPPAPPVAPPAPPAPPVQPPAEPAFVPPVAPPAPPVQQPTYAPPVPPAPPAPPVQQPYAPPAPPAPPVQGYAPPAPPMGYAPPAPQAPAASGKKSRLPMLLGIGAAIVLIILAIIFIPKLFGGGNNVLGRYEGTSISMMGMTLKGEELAAVGETWIELKEDDEMVLMLMDEKVKGTWSLDGDEITIEADGEEVTGTLEDGVLELKIEQEGMEMTLVFEKGKSDKGGKETEGPVAQQAEEVGYWTLLYMEGETEDDSLDEETVKTMKAMGMEVFLNLFDDGTGEGSFFSPTKITWEDGELRLDDLYMDCTYTIEDGQLTLEMTDVGGLYVFVPGEGEAPKVEVGTGNTQTEPVDTTAAPALADYDWWEGDWYGWWIVTDATGEYAEVKDLYWDAYARIELTGENTGRIIFWDEEYSYQGPLANVEIEFEEGWGDKGAFASVKGDFDGTNVGYYDWLVDPDFGPVDEFENMIGIEGTFTDPNNNANTYDYLIILRPWGLDWEDVRNADTSDSLYEDMMPSRYDDWYLPLIEKGIKELPDSFEAGQELLK